MNQITPDALHEVLTHHYNNVTRNIILLISLSFIAYSYEKKNSNKKTRLMIPITTILLTVAIINILSLSYIIYKYQDDNHIQVFNKLSLLLLFIIIITMLVKFIIN